jgi:hypothetical protein
MAALSSDFADFPAIPNAERPTTFAKCRRENLPSIGFPRQVSEESFSSFRSLSMFVPGQKRETHMSIVDAPRL